MTRKKAGGAADYNRLNDELTALLAKLEDGDLDIDEAVECYERGLQIIRQLENDLLNAENRVTELRAEYADQVDKQE